jgi:hypothetical protein
MARQKLRFLHILLLPNLTFEELYFRLSIKGYKLGNTKAAVKEANEFFETPMQSRTCVTDGFITRAEHGVYLSAVYAAILNIS